MKNSGFFIFTVFAIVMWIFWGMFEIHCIHTQVQRAQAVIQILDDTPTNKETSSK